MGSFIFIIFILFFGSIVKGIKGKIVKDVGSKALKEFGKATKNVDINNVNLDNIMKIANNFNNKNQNKGSSELEKLNKRMDDARKNNNYGAKSMNTKEFNHAHQEGKNLMKSEVLESNIIWQNEKNRIKLQNDLFNLEMAKMHEENRKLMQECRNIHR